MSERSQAASKPDFTVIFSAIGEQRHSDLSEQSRKISRQAETIEMIAQATDRLEINHRVSTYFSN